MEILITLLIVVLASYIIFKSVRKSSKGGCSCGNCSKTCPMNEKNKVQLK